MGIEMLLSLSMSIIHYYFMRISGLKDEYTLNKILFNLWMLLTIIILKWG